MNKAQSSHRAVVLQALFVTFLWSTSYVLVKIGLREIPALTFAGIRYALAFFVLLVLAIRGGHIQGLRGIRLSTWLRLIVLGLTFYTLTQGGNFLALNYLPAVSVNLLYSLTSIFVAMMGIPALGERPTVLQWAGIWVAIIGAVVYFYPVSFPASQIIGITAAVVGLLANSVSSILGREINRQRDLDPIQVTLVSMGVGAFVLLTIGIQYQGLPKLSLTNWGIIAWLAVVNTAFAFTLWNRTLRTLSAMESSIINNTMLIQIPILSVLFLGERINLKEIIGLVLAGLGTVIVQLARRDEEQERDQGSGIRD
ncbi:MAG: EamA family transporter [Anaerolineaceae bacterium]|nr:MAG: EamA family transporter [Anaerolineaceae bacterium]